MWDVFHSFAAGITFAVGVCVGAYLCRLATREGRKEEAEEIKQHFAFVRDNLVKQVVQAENIAYCLRIISDDVESKQSR